MKGVSWLTNPFSFTLSLSLSFSFYLQPGRILTTNFNLFSLQHPLVRDFQLEPIFMEVTNNYGILSTNYELIKVVINGRSRGIFEIEEVGTKEHIERSGRRNSVVLRLEVRPNNNLRDVNISESGFPETYRTAQIDTLNTSKIIKDPLLNEYKKVSTSLLRSYLDGQLKASEVFDTKLMGTY